MQGLGPGTLLSDRYAVHRRLSAGYPSASAEHWSAHDTTLDREVVVLAVPAEDPFAEAAVDAARRAAGVGDARLVRILDVGEEGPVRYVVQERHPGARQLAELLEDGPLPADQARRMVGELAVGLELARNRGLHHLRLDPRVVTRGPDGGVRLAGVAVAAALAGRDDADSEVATREDAVGLVALLYAALTGRWPLSPAVPGLDAAPRLGPGVAAPSAISGGVPGDLDRLCEQVLVSATGPGTPGDVARALGPWTDARSPGPAGSPGTAALAASATGMAAMPPAEAAAEQGDEIPGDAPRAAPVAPPDDAASVEDGAQQPGDPPPEAREVDQPPGPVVVRLTDTVPAALRGLARLARLRRPSAAVATGGGGGGEPGSEQPPELRADVAGARPGGGTSGGGPTVAAGAAAGAPLAGAGTDATAAPPRPGADATAADADGGGDTDASEASAATPRLSAALTGSGSPTTTGAGGGAVSESRTSPAGTTSHSGTTEGPSPEPTPAVASESAGDPAGVVEGPPSGAGAATVVAAAGSGAAAVAGGRAAQPHFPARAAQLPDVLTDDAALVEPPLPMLPPETGLNPPPGQSRIVLLVVLVFVLLCLVAGYCGIRGLGAGLSLPEDTARTTMATTEPGSPPPGPAASTPPAPSGTTPAAAGPSLDTGPIAVLSAKGFDPFGDKRENQADAAKVYDGKPQTAWTSERYNSANFGGLKRGVGVILDLGQETRIGKAVLTLGERGQNVRLLATNKQSVEGAYELGSRTSASGTVTFTPPAAAPKTQFVIVWFTRAALERGKFQATLAEIALS